MDQDRRKVLKTIGAVGAVSLAGCNNLLEDNNSPPDDQPIESPGNTENNSNTDNNNSRNNSENNSTDGNGNGDKEFTGEINRFELSTDRSSIDLPGVWTSNHDIEDYQVHTSLEVEANQELGNITLENNNEEVRSWENVENSFSDGKQIPLEKLSEEENQLEIELNEDWNKVLDRSQRQETVVKQVSEIYKIDFQHGKNTELRNQIKESLENPEQYLSHVEEQVTDTITSSYQTPEELKHDKEVIDLAALDFHHRNNYLQMGTWVHDIIETLDKDDLEVKQELRKARNNELTQKYPDPHNSFSFEAFQEAESLAEGHKMLMPYIANFEWTRGENLHSTKDKNYAAIIQEAFDRFNENVDVHVWAFSVGFGVHGNGLMYDETNDSLHVMETVHASDANQGLHPYPIEESNWLNTDTYWHPIQFKDGNYGEPLPGETETRQFESAKLYGSAAFANIGSHYTDMPENGGQIALTTGLTEKTLTALGEYNLPETDWEFDNIRNVARTMEKCRRTPGKYVIAENTGEEIGADIYDITDYSTEEENAEELLDEVWADEEGIYDNFEDILTEFETGEYTTISETAETLAS